MQAARDVPVAPGADEKGEERPGGAGDQREGLGDQVQRGVAQHLLL